MAECLKCGHGWSPRVAGRPVKCPSCAQPKWWEMKRYAIQQGGGSGQRGGAVSGVPSGIERDDSRRKEAGRESLVGRREQAIRSLAAVKPGFDEGVGGDAEAVVPSCVSCENPMTEGRGKLAGKWACMDESCGMRGIEQKGKR